MTSRWPRCTPSNSPTATWRGRALGVGEPGDPSCTPRKPTTGLSVPSARGSASAIRPSPSTSSTVPRGRRRRDRDAVRRAPRRRRRVELDRRAGSASASSSGDEARRRRATSNGPIARAPQLDAVGVAEVGDQRAHVGARGALDRERRRARRRARAARSACTVDLALGELDRPRPRAPARTRAGRRSCTAEYAGGRWRMPPVGQHERLGRRAGPARSRPRGRRSSRSRRAARRSRSAWAAPSGSAARASRGRRARAAARSRTGRACRRGRPSARRRAAAARRRRRRARSSRPACRRAGRRPTSAHGALRQSCCGELRRAGTRRARRLEVGREARRLAVAAAAAARGRSPRRRRGRRSRAARPCGAPRRVGQQLAHERGDRRALDRAQVVDDALGVALVGARGREVLARQLGHASAARRRSARRALEPAREQLELALRHALVEAPVDRVHVDAGARSARRPSRARACRCSRT